MAEQKVILITGASSGFGHLAAARLAAKNHIVYASMRGTDGRNKSPAAALRQANANIRVVELDVTDGTQVQRGVERIVAEQGRIDVAVNNAGVAYLGVTEGYTDAQHRAQMDANYFGPMRLFRAVLPHMREARSGLVLTVTSIAGRLVFPAFAAYSATKFAAEALAEGYRYELAPFGVDSVILEPGPFNTQLLSNTAKPADTATVAAYGEHGERLSALQAGFEAFYAAESEGQANPQIVVDDMIKLVETPFGRRPLRTVSGVDYGTRSLNEAGAPIQAGVLEAMQMTDLNPHTVN